MVRNKKFRGDTTPLTPAEMQGVPLEQIAPYLDVFPEDEFYFRLLSDQEEGFDDMSDVKKDFL